MYMNIAKLLNVYFSCLYDTLRTLNEHCTAYIQMSKTEYLPVFRHTEIQQ